MLSLSARHAFHRSVVFGLLATGLVAFANGCGPNYKARAVVKGKVTMSKKPLTSGTVVFHHINGITSTAVIDTDGNYVMNDAPIGDVKVSVTVNLPPGMGPGPKTGRVDWTKATKGLESKDPEGDTAIPLISKVPSKVVRIEDKYSKPETSGLSYKVEKGEQVYNIEL